MTENITATEIVDEAGIVAEPAEVATTEVAEATAEEVAAPAEAEAAEVPVPAQATAPVLPAWRTLADGYVLKDRDILANCAPREGLAGVVSKKWADKNTQLHAIGSECFKVAPKAGTRTESVAWLETELALESARQQAGQDRQRYFCTRCVIEYKGAPSAAVAVSAAAEAEGAPAEVEVPADDLVADAADVADVAEDIAAEQVEVPAEVSAAKVVPARRRRAAKVTAK